MRWFAKGSTYVPQAWEKNTTILALGPLSENNWKGTWISGVSIIKIAWTSFYALESSIFRITFNTSFPIYWGKVYQKYTNIYTYLLYTLLFAYIYIDTRALWQAYRDIGLTHSNASPTLIEDLAFLQYEKRKIKYYSLGKTWYSTGIGCHHLHIQIQTKVNIIFKMQICKKLLNFTAINDWG